MVDTAVAEKEAPASQKADLPTIEPGGSPFVGHHVVARTWAAGVHIGELVRRDGDTVVLKDARRLWKWNGAFTLSEVAQQGISRSGSRMAVAVPLIELSQVHEIIPTTPKARASFDAVHE